MRHLVIGDIQGCYAELLDLVEQAGLASGDRIVAVGDLIDRGPASPAVLDFFTTRPDTLSVMGNHERKHVRWGRGEGRPALSQRITRLQFGEARYAAALTRMAELPPYLDLPDALVVHALFEPGIPLQHQREEVLLGTLNGERTLKESCARPWYEAYDGERPLIVGHHDYLETGEPFVHADRVFGIDTGCCFGRRLTGLLLPEFRFVSVPARDDHWKRVKQSYSQLRLSDAPDETLRWLELERVQAAIALHGPAGSADGDRAERLEMLARAGRDAMDRITRIVERENLRALAELRSSLAFDQLPPADQGRLYASHIGPSPIASLLHAARKGMLSTEWMRRRLRSPAEAIAFARRLSAGRRALTEPDTPPQPGPADRRYVGGAAEDKA